MRTVRSVCFSLLVGSSLTFGLGCSDDDKEGSQLNPGGSGTGGGTATGGGIGTGTGGSVSGSTGGSSSTTGGGSSVIPGANACAGLPLETGEGGAAGSTGEACVGVGQEAEAVPVDMYIMMDKSQSMVENFVTGTTVTRWAAVQEAVRQFVANEAAANIGVGIQFFGQSGFADDNVDCDVSRYATPEVGIGLLPGNASAVSTAITDEPVGGLTPTGPAVQGALTYAKQYARDNFGRETIVVLVTDGFPTQCEPRQPAAIAEIARDAFETEPRVRTYVIGIAGTFNLDGIARGGGTSNAILIEEGNVQERFLQEMLNITSGNLACDFNIPEPENPDDQIDFGKVQVVYKPATGDPQEIPKVDSLAGCGASAAGGWYYNNPTNPSSILVCPCTCANFRAGSVEVRLGCEPRPPPVR